MATAESPTPSSQASDSNDLAGFGYKQELDRSLGSFSSFAAGFSYISILTGVTALFGLATANAGPGVWWTWPVVVGGQSPGRAVLHGDGRLSIRSPAPSTSGQSSSPRPIARG